MQHIYAITALPEASGIGAFSGVTSPIEHWTTRVATAGYAISSALSSGLANAAGMSLLLGAQARLLSANQTLTFNRDQQTWTEEAEDSVEEVLEQVRGMFNGAQGVSLRTFPVRFPTWTGSTGSLLDPKPDEPKLPGPVVGGGVPTWAWAGGGLLLALVLMRPRR